MAIKPSKSKRGHASHRLTYTKMRVRGNKLIIGIGACQQCSGRGTIIPTWEEDCGPCAGKGIIRYRLFDRICHRCKGSRKKVVYGEDAVTCPRCKGINSQRFEKGDRNDYVHARILAHIPAKVYRLSFSPTEAEKRTLNTMSTLFDGGRSRYLHDAVLLKNHRPHGAAAGQISKEDGTLALHFGIFVTPETRIMGVVFDRADIAWIAERNQAAAKAARSRRRAEKKCCPTCRRPFKAAA